MNKYFQKLSAPKFILLILLWFLSVGILGLVLELISPRFGNGIIAAVSYFVLYWGIKFFALNPVDEMDIRKEPIEKIPNKTILIFIPFLVGGLVNVVYVLILQQFLPKFFEFYTNQPDLLGGMNLKENPVEILLLFTAVVILAPIVEEFVFRGVFFNLLGKKKSALFALVVSSLFFGALHFVTMVPTAVIGLALAFIYHKTGSLRLVILGHMFNNFFAFIVSMIAGSFGENQTVQGILGGVLFLVYVIGMVYFIRYISANKAFFQKKTPLYRLNLNNEEKAYLNESHKIIDISCQIETGMKVYPGDPAVVIKEVNTLEKDGFSLRKIEMNTHAGTHVDFPSHYLPGVLDKEIDLDAFYGKVQVLNHFCDTIQEGILRVVARNGVLTLERAHELVGHGIILIGTAGESIEDKGDDEVHKLLLSKGICILENLELGQVMPRLYTLVAFPLKIKEADASPVRAVLIDDVYRSI